MLRTGPQLPIIYQLRQPPPSSVVMRRAHGGTANDNDSSLTTSNSDVSMEDEDHSTVWYDIDPKNDPCLASLRLISDDDDDDQHHHHGFKDSSSFHKFLTVSRLSTGSVNRGSGGGSGQRSQVNVNSNTTPKLTVVSLLSSSSLSAASSSSSILHDHKVPKQLSVNTNDDLIRQDELDDLSRSPYFKPLFSLSFLDLRERSTDDTDDVYMCNDWPTTFNENEFVASTPNGSLNMNEVSTQLFDDEDEIDDEQEDEEQEVKAIVNKPYEIECKKVEDNDEESEKTLTQEVVKSDESSLEPRLSQETQISEVVMIPEAYRITSSSENSLDGGQDKDISLEEEDSSSTKMTKDIEPLSQLSLSDSRVVVMISKSCQVSQNDDSPPQSQSSKDSDTSNEEYFTQNHTSQTDQTKSDIDSQDSKEMITIVDETLTEITAKEAIKAAEEEEKEEEMKETRDESNQTTSSTYLTPRVLISEQPAEEESNAELNQMETSTSSSLSLSLSMSTNNTTIDLHPENRKSTSSKVIVIKRFSIGANTTTNTTWTTTGLMKRRVDPILDICKKYSAECARETAAAAEAKRKLSASSTAAATSTLSTSIATAGGVFIDISPTRHKSNMKRKDWLLDVLQNYAHMAK